MKQQIMDVIQKQIKRDGIGELVKFLLESDYFTAPASTIFHGARVGGLAEHSWHVYKLLQGKNISYDCKYSEETIAIAGLFHDLCKVGFYKVGGEKPSAGQTSYLKTLAGNQYPELEKGGIDKNYATALINFYKNGGEKPVRELSWSIDDEFPIGHGEKSVIMLQRFIKLTDEEAMAIRWHMVAFDAGIHFDYPSGKAFRRAVELSNLITILFTSDYEASNIAGK